MEFDSELVKRRFSKNAQNYHKLNTLQREVAKELVASIATKPRNILDLGAGSGAVYSQIDWQVDRFVAVDFAENMCAIHPTGANITVKQLDFNNIDQMKELQRYQPLDLIISASALQWSANLKTTLDLIKELGSNIAIALFTDRTFKELRDFAGLATTLPSALMASDLISQIFDADLYTKQYQLAFPTRKDLFTYIKNSGIGGGIRSIPFKKVRKLVEQYPEYKLNYEVLFAISKKIKY